MINKLIIKQELLNYHEKHVLFLVFRIQFLLVELCRLFDSIYSIYYIIFDVYGINLGTGWMICYLELHRCFMVILKAMRG